MKFTKEFKLECVRKYKDGIPIDYPGDCKRDTFYKSVLNWVGMFDALGEVGLEHRVQKRTWVDKFGMIQLVLEGRSIRSVALANSKTLDDWRVHDGVDIKADVGSEVYAAEGGTVENIYFDDTLGITVVIDYGNSYKTVYSNLESENFIVKGQSVKKGEVINKVGTTAISEFSDDPHLHFGLMFQNKLIDPTKKLNMKME